MHKTIDAASHQALTEVAFGLLWLGYDRVADAIYAVIEEHEAHEEQAEWAEAFAG